MSIELNLSVFEQALADERAKLDLDFSQIQFDPKKHPRDHGKFMKVLGGMKHQDTVAFPDGTRVTKMSAGLDTKYHVHSGKGRGLGAEDSVDGAAKKAYDASARSEHPASLGGPDSYNNHAEIVTQDAKDKAQEARFKADRQGAKHKAKKGDKNAVPVGDMHSALRELIRNGRAGTLSAETEIDEDKLELALSEARRQYGVNLDFSMIHFDPNKHPRDPLGHWAKVVSGLQPGQEAQLKDGIAVHRNGSGGGFTVRQAGTSRGIKQVDSAEKAASESLTSSAKSIHPHSLGGSRPHADIGAATAAMKPTDAPTKGYPGSADDWAKLTPGQKDIWHRQAGAKRGLPGSTPGNGYGPKSSSASSAPAGHPHKEGDTVDTPQGSGRVTAVSRKGDVMVELHHKKGEFKSFQQADVKKPGSGSASAIDKTIADVQAEYEGHKRRGNGTAASQAFQRLQKLKASKTGGPKEDQHGPAEKLKSGDRIKVGSDTREVTAVNSVPESKAYNNENGDKIDVWHKNPKTGGRIASRVHKDHRFPKG